MNTDVSNPTLTLVILAGVLVGVGVYLLLERSLTRIILGVSIASNGVNILFLVAGGSMGRPPLNAPENEVGMVDPLPQAFMLTAIVITLGTIAFVLAMAYRSWQLNGHDEVQDDLEDRRLARRAALDQVEERVTDDSGATLEEDAAAMVDETATDPERELVPAGGPLPEEREDPAERAQDAGLEPTQESREAGGHTAPGTDREEHATRAEGEDEGGERT
ncbi:MAG TPA: Na(+)/H(+) antiporter subunit C [Actinomycetales bacterium]|nr:Na(+)/H(+) antiporter subunit C [Actinomycetales bacterium]